MAIKTTTISNGGGNFTKGWQSATINKAEYGTYEGTRFLDVWFNELGEHLNARVYEKNTKATNEEFAIASLFRFTNAGIVDVLEDPTGKKPIVQYDDEASHLIGKTINIYIYKDGSYHSVLRSFAPVPQENGEKLHYSDKDVEYWKGRAESYFNDWVKPNLSNNADDFIEADTDEIKEMVAETTTVNGKDDNLPF